MPTYSFVSVCIMSRNWHISYMFVRKASQLVDPSFLVYASIPCLMRNWQNHPVQSPYHPNRANMEYWTKSISTQPNGVGFEIHQKFAYFMKNNIVKTPLIRAGLRVVFLLHPVGQFLPDLDLFLNGSLENYVWRPWEFSVHFVYKPQYTSLAAPNLTWSRESP